MTLDPILDNPDVRWTAARKAMVVAAVQHGDTSLTDVLQRYRISREEFSQWQALYAEHNVEGLKTTKLRHYRKIR